MAVTEASHVASRALDDLYRAHGADVYRYALAVLGNHADAEDVTQTTFLNAYRALEQGVRPRKPANWLLTIASNAIKQRFRRDQARPREVELDREPATSGDESDAPSVGELLTALSKIPPQQRQAIVLREFEGRSYTEIADILGVTTSALETLLFRARRSLAEELSHQLTCTEAQHAISRAADGRLGRKEKRRLQEHLHECPDCSQFARLQQRHSKALRGLALVPVPLSLALFKGFEGSAAAATLPAAAGAGIGSTAVGTGTVAAGSSVGSSATASGGGLFAGGLVVKAAAVVAAAGVAGGVTVAGVKHVTSGRSHEHAHPAASLETPISPRRSHSLHSQRAGIARGQTDAVPPGQLRRQHGQLQKANHANAHSVASAPHGSAGSHAQRANATRGSHGSHGSQKPSTSVTPRTKHEPAPNGSANAHGKGNGSSTSTSADTSQASSTPDASTTPAASSPSSTTTSGATDSSSATTEPTPSASEGHSHTSDHGSGGKNH